MNSPNPQKPSISSQLQATLSKVIPLVNHLTKPLLVTLLLGFLAASWSFIWLYVLQQASLTLSIVIALIALCPVLILLQLWLALKNLQDLPDTVQDITQDVRQDLKTKWQSFSREQTKSLSVFGGLKNLFQIRSLTKDLDDVLLHSFQIGLLINPFFLLLAIISFVLVVVFIFLGTVLGIISLFS